MEEEPLGYRVGIFFIFVGLLTLIPFVASDQLKSPDYRYFFTAFFLLVIGGILLWRNRPQRPQSATRFRLFKRKSKEKRKE
jgi:quinol-cytochrome oxidoreductase complex cytochrome b subunit